MAEKEPTFATAVTHLRRDLGSEAFVEVPYWDGDRIAIGLARPDGLRVLAYILWKPDSGMFYVECELPPKPDDDDDALYAVAWRGDDLDYPSMRTAVERHLTPPR